MTHEQVMLSLSRSFFFSLLSQRQGTDLEPCRSLRQQTGLLVAALVAEDLLDLSVVRVDGASSSRVQLDECFPDVLCQQQVAGLRRVEAVDLLDQVLGVLADLGPVVEVLLPVGVDEDELEVLEAGRLDDLLVHLVQRFGPSCGRIPDSLVSIDILNTC